MKIENLIENVPQARIIEMGEEEVQGLAYHSASVKRGDLFVAIRGFVADGHDFIQEALERGAAAIMVENLEKVPSSTAGKVAVIQAANTRMAMALVSDAFYGHPSGRLKVVGVTGTNGKTTTTYLVENIFRMAGKMTGLVGTVSYRIGEREMPVGRTTPESVDLQRMLAEMAREGVEVASMEVSSHALDLHRIDGCDFAVGIFTNLSQDHLDYHGDMESYYSAKRQFFAAEEERRIKVRGIAVNLDDPYGRRLIEELGGEVFTYGTNRAARLRGELLSTDLKGSRLRLSYGSEDIRLETRLVGRFNLYNIMAAVSASLLLGLGWEEIMRGVESCPGVPGRFQAVEEGQDFAVIIDYAHTPDSLRKAIIASREIARGRVITVFGCGGDRDVGKRPMMGRYSGELSDYTVITSDNPRSEDPSSIIRQIEEGIREVADASKYEVVVDRREAISRALELAGRGDVVLVAGKGHEQGQIFADRVVPFDDFTVAGELLRRRMG